MADPRTFTVKQCEPAYAANSGAAIGNSTSTRKDFFNSVGKVGDLAVLNSVAGGKIGTGLRNLASISNSIRTGCGSLPSVVSSSLDAGANWVLSQTGIAPTVINALQGFHPNVANQAFGQAQQIYSQVKQGKFKSTDIPGYIQSFTNLDQLASHIFTPGAGDVQSNLGEHCMASPYAVDLIARAPKYKFLFVVQFIVDGGYAGLSADIGPLEMAFAVKRSTRPEVHFVHDDVNYYNYRTKVATKTEYQEMNMTFHDDTMNLATQFYKAYLQAMSPISGMHPTDSSMLEDSGMDFVGNTLKANAILKRVPGSAYGASHGPLAGDNKQVFKEIRLYHVFDYGQHMTVHRFMNPKITQMNFDELDMSVGSEGCSLTINFAYDGVFIDENVDMSKPGSEYNIASVQRGAVYPLRYNSGATATEGPQSSGINPYGAPVQPATSCDPLNPTSTGSLVSSLLPKIPAVPSLSDLSSKFSNPLGGLFG